MRKIFWFVFAPLLQWLLLRVKAEGGFWPTEKTLRVAHGCFSAWSVELVITRKRKGRKEILLAMYDGGVKEFHEWWHIPGGYDRVDSASIQEDCSRTALRELGGVDVIYVSSYPHPHKWLPGEHPYGRPLSLFVECDLRGSVEESATLRFFDRNALPKNLVPCHRTFIRDNIL